MLDLFHQLAALCHRNVSQLFAIEFEDVVLRLKGGGRRLFADDRGRIHHHPHDFYQCPIFGRFVTIH